MNLMESEINLGKTGAGIFNLNEIRKDFPLLSSNPRGREIVYFDNAATTQKPRQVLEKMTWFYEQANSNVHRGNHLLSQEATNAYERARIKIQKYINAPDPREIIFVRGATEAINLVANTFGRRFIKEGDEILISCMEHHSNIVPWQMLCEQTGAVLKVIPITDDGEIIVEEYEKLLSSKTKLVSVVHVSNSLGTVNPVKEMTELAHNKGIPVLVDGAQAASHLEVDVKSIGCDFYIFSGHKMYGPTGIGVLYGKRSILEALPPYQGGGDMIKSVGFDRTTYNEIPMKFEAGTPNIAGTIGLGEAVDYIGKIGMRNIVCHERSLLGFATEKLSEIKGLKIIGKAAEKASVISFIMPGIEPKDLGTLLDNFGFALRTGHHCTQPLMQRLNLHSTTRVSLAMYNTIHEIEKLTDFLKRVRKMYMN